MRGIGPTRETAFEQAAIALSSVISDVADIAAEDSVEVSCTGPDDDMLLVEWLNALIFEMATRRMLFKRFAVHIDGQTLHGTARGELVEQARHRPAVEVKGATLTELSVRQDDGGQWIAQCVVDV